MVAMLDDPWQNRTQLLKGVTKGPFHQSLVKIGPAVSEVLNFEENSHRVLCLTKLGCGGHVG